MSKERSGFIERFEAWLTPSLFYFFLALLFFLNLITWFSRWPTPSGNISAAAVTELQAQRERLRGLLISDCNSPELQSYARDELISLPEGLISTQRSIDGQRDSLLELLDSASVFVIHPDGFGSGFFIDPTTIVTNRHVIEGVKGGAVVITSKAIRNELKAKVVSVTRSSEFGNADFALLRLEQAPPGINVLPIAKEPLSLQNVVAVGFPGSGIRSDQGQVPAPIYTTGVVSAVQPQASGATLIMHTADISPGSSGGALVDQCGSVVGVNTFVQSADHKAEGRRLYALSAESLQKFLDASGQRYNKARDCEAKRLN